MSSDFLSERKEKSTSGDENENVIFAMDAKIYHFCTDDASLDSQSAFDQGKASPSSTETEVSLEQKKSEKSDESPKVPKSTKLVWKEKGRGRLFFYESKENDDEGKKPCRLVLRSDVTDKLRLNAPIWHGVNMKSIAEKSVQMTLVNHTVDESAPGLYIIKVGFGRLKTPSGEVIKTYKHYWFLQGLGAPRPESSPDPKLQKFIRSRISSV